MTHRELRSYDHRIKAQIAASGDPNMFPELQIPVLASAPVKTGSKEKMKELHTEGVATHGDPDS